MIDIYIVTTNMHANILEGITGTRINIATADPQLRQRGQPISSEWSKRHLIHVVYGRHAGKNLCEGQERFSCVSSIVSTRWFLFSLLHTSRFTDFVCSELWNSVVYNDPCLHIWLHGREFSQFLPAGEVPVVATCSSAEPHYVVGQLTSRPRHSA